jgi:anti-sigma B factor antagonist
MACQVIVLGIYRPAVGRQNPPIFDVCTIMRGDETTVFVDGELDLSTAPVLERELAQRRVTAARSVVVDLERVEFVDLSGLRPIVSLAQAKRPAGRVAITAGAWPVQRLLDLSGLADCLCVVSPRGPG